MQLIASNEEQSPDIDCIMVDDFMVDAIWPKVEPIFKKYPPNDFDVYELDEVHEKCSEGLWQLWLLMKDEMIVGCFCTNIGQDVNNKIVNVFNLVGSDSRHWVKKIDEKICDFVRLNGCKHYFAAARDGFRRYVPELKEVGKMYIRRVDN